MTREVMNSRYGSGIEKRIFQDGKVGATAGWTVRAAADTWMSTVAASQTAATLVVPLPGLKAGDELRGFHMVGQIESGGNTVTLDAQLYEFEALAAGSSASALSGTDMTQLSVTADTEISNLNSKKDFSAVNRVVVEEGKTYFALLTVTTNASTDLELLGFVLYVKPKVD